MKPKTKRGPGRPPIPEEERRSERIELRLTVAEREEWEAIAERLGLSVSDALREGMRLLARKQRGSRS
jgi:hypothetical protein